MALPKETSERWNSNKFVTEALLAITEAVGTQSGVVWKIPQALR